MKRVYLDLMHLRDVIGLVRPYGLAFRNSSNCIILSVQTDFCFDHSLKYQSVLKGMPYVLLNVDMTEKRNMKQL